ncbi:MAG: DEAD/DEAH box helicase [Oscillospiraceae bacterium]
MNNNFQELNLSEEVLKAISDMNYDEATEIQFRTIPLLLNGQDVIGRSSTGTGKTAAFGIPAVENIVAGKKPQVLILCPTRELAMQISGEISKYAKYKTSVKQAILYGGQPMDGQIRQLKIANIVIGTPGRVMDHMRRHTLKLDELRTVVLDEADEMLNMGFYEDIQTILKSVPETRQTVLFSATMPPAIMKITQEFQSHPEIIAVDKGKRTLGAISQYYYQVPQARKMDAVNLLLQKFQPTRSVIFCNTKKMVDELTEYLDKHGFQAAGLHGDMRQIVRTQVMNNFKAGKTKILIATDVAARGIDVDDIEAVFNFDIPQEFEYYIHRIGRTARAGKTGISCTFACNRTQIRKVEDIQRFVGAPITLQPLPSAEEIVDKRNKKLISKIEKALDKPSAPPYERILAVLLEKEYAPEALCLALLSMAAEKSGQIIPIVKNTPESPRRESDHSSSARIRLKIDAGREQKIAPNFIVGAIVESTGLSAKSIGKIDIYADHTTVDMTSEDAQIVLDSMQDAKIKNCKVKISVMPTKSSSGSGNRYGKRPDRKPQRNRSASDKGYQKGKRYTD